MNGPLVSVLMTTYNREKYVAEAIESVLASTYKNFELIIVDDQSTDKTMDIINSYAEKNRRVTVYVNEKNLGDYPNRNKAAYYAKGKYLKYVDADDLIYPFGLEQLVYYMEQFPEAGYGLCTLAQNKSKVFPFELNPHEAYRYHYFGPGLFHRAPLSSIIRREVFEEVGGFSPIRMAGDYDMWHKLSAKYPVVLMPQGIIWYREHEEQEMSHYHEFALSYEKSFVKHLLSDVCPLTNKEVYEILVKRKKASYKQILKSIFRLRISQLCIELNKLRLYNYN